MGQQPLPLSIQHHFHLALRKTELLGNGRDGVKIPISADKDPTIHRRQGHHKIVNHFRQFCGLDLMFYIVVGRNAIGQLVKGQHDLTASALFRSSATPLVNRYSPRDFSQECRKDGRTMGRHIVPCIKVCMHWSTKIGHECLVNNTIKM